MFLKMWDPDQSCIIEMYPRGGGGALPCLGVLGMCRWTGCLLELPVLAQGVFFELPELRQGPFLAYNSGQPLSMYFADFSIKFLHIFQPNSLNML